jgi:hypothetical protein
MRRTKRLSSISMISTKSLLERRIRVSPRPSTDSGVCSFFESTGGPAQAAMLLPSLLGRQPASSSASAPDGTR